MPDITGLLASLSPEQLQSLADRLMSQSPARQTDDITPHLPRPDFLPLSYSQEGVWVLESMGLVGSAYLESIAFRVEGLLDTRALEKALAEIVRRHDILRTRIITTSEGYGAQIIDAPGNFRLEIADLSLLNEQTRNLEVSARIRDMSAQPLSLSQGPLFRVHLWKLSDTDHVLSLAAHHIIWDGWSIGIFIGELGILYPAYAAGLFSPLPELPIQYWDYALWQRDWLKGAVLDGHLAYWRGQLTDLMPLELPMDRPRSAAASFKGEHIGFSLSRDSSVAVNALARSQGATLFMTLLAAFKAVLSRWTGQEDLVVGSTTAGRKRNPISRLIGFFVNSIALRTSLSRNPTFIELLGRVKQVALDAYAHDELPLEKVVAELQPERDLSRQPLFQIMFVLQNQFTKTTMPELGGLRLEPFELGISTSKFDLTIELAETQDAVHGWAEYATDVFDKASIDRLMESFNIMLEGVLAHSGRRLSELPLLSKTQMLQLTQWSSARSQEQLDGSIAELFESKAVQTPQALAVVLEDQRLSYADLNDRANRLAHYLRKLGVGPEICVCLCMERSLDLVVAILAIVKAGGVYVPLDPVYPKERLVFMVEDVKAPVVIAKQEHSTIFSGLSTRLVYMDTDWQEISACSRDNPPPVVTANNAAYIIFTSGSTGQPKGVVVTHGNVLRLFKSTEAWFSFGATDVWTLFHSYAFDFSVWELWGALLYGGRLVIVPYWKSRSSNEFLDLLIKEKVTVLNQTPSAFQQLLTALENQPQSDLSMRLVIFGGEALDTRTLRSWFESNRDRQCQLVNMYGITETTVHVTYHTIARADLDMPGSWSPIGRPIPDLQVWVLDQYGSLAPIGVWGELFVGGAGVARGYLNRSDVTATRFVPNAFDGSAGARLYASGDIGRWRPDGCLEYLGRRDHQVKIRGHRIELGEIEAALLRHPGVQSCVVIARPQRERQQLVAYIVGNASATELRASLLQVLPDFMVPAAFVPLASLPLTPNGKLDRRALPAPDLTPQDQYVAPRNHTEQVLAQIWANALRRERVGIHDNFFDMGGDSIIAIQIAAHAAGAEIWITVRDMFEHQTIAELAVVAAHSQPVMVEQTSVEGDVPLSPIQHWFFEGTPIEPNHFNQWIMLQCRRALVPEFVHDALKHLITHHDALRLQFWETTAGWSQWNAAPGDVDCSTIFEYHDLASLAASEQNGSMVEIAGRLQASFDLASGPLVRVALFELGSGQAQHLLFIVHHLAVDAVSWRILLEDFQIVYGQIETGSPTELPPKTTSFKSWAERLVSYATMPEIQQAINYWQELPWSSVVPLRVDYDCSDNTVAISSALTVTLDAPDTQILLQELPRACGSQINEILLTALVEAFSGWTLSHTLLVDLEGHGREELFENVDLSRTVGWFTSIFPVLLDTGAAVDIKSKISLVGAQLQRVPQKGLAYGILRYLAHADLLAALPQAQVSFNYLGQTHHNHNSVALFGPAPQGSGSSQGGDFKRRHSISVDGVVSSDQLRFTWTYSPAVHTPTTIQFLATRFLECLQELVNQCSSPDIASPNQVLVRNGNERAANKAPTLIGPTGRKESGQEGNIEGEFHLMPIAQEMLTRVPDLFHRNVYSTVWECHEPLSPPLVKEALGHLILHHDGLRMRLHHGAAGAQSWIEKPGEFHEDALFEYIDLRPLPSAAEQDTAFRAARKRLINAIDCSKAPLWRIALVDLGVNRPQVLMLVFHHLCIDPHSLDVFCEDLLMAYDQLSQGVQVVLPKKTTSIKRWSQVMADYVESPAALDEVNYWRSLPWEKCLPLPADPNLENRVDKALCIVDLLLDKWFLEGIAQVQRKFGVSTNEILLTALAEAFAGWTEQRVFWVEVLDHGRINSLGGAAVDLTRTVGWLSALVPTVLDLRSTHSPEQSLVTAKKQMRENPKHGIGYGALRYIGGNDFISSLPAPPVRLNHMGNTGARALGSRFLKLDTTQKKDKWNAPEKAVLTARPSPDEWLHRQIDIQSYAFDEGSGGLLMCWLHDSNVHPTSKVEQVASRFVVVLERLINGQ